MSEVVSGFPQAIKRLARKLDAIETFVPSLVYMLHAIRQDSVGKLKEFSEARKSVELPSDGKTFQFTVTPEDLPRFRKLERRFDSVNTATEVLARTIIVSMVSQFDVLVASLVRGIYAVQPQLLHDSEKSITYGDILKFDTIDIVKEALIEKEVESVLRENHEEQLRWFEKKIKVSLKPRADLWSHFIEITQRRNLFVHADGVVSSQYLAVCRKHGVPLPADQKVGDRLPVSSAYARQAYEALYEMGVQLGQTVWRKIAPKEQLAADENLNDIGFDLLLLGEYSLAARVFEFAQGLQNFREHNHFDVFWALNLAQSHKWSGDQGKCLSILSGHRWAELNELSQLGAATLKDEFEGAANLVRRIGTSNVPGKSGYLLWPIFREIRKQNCFQEAYEAVFGEPLVLQQEYGKTQLLREAFSILDGESPKS